MIDEHEPLVLADGVSEELSGRYFVHKVSFVVERQVEGPNVGTSLELQHVLADSTDFIANVHCAFHNEVDV